MKILLILLVLCLPTLAQKVEVGAQVYLIDKSRALAIYHGSPLNPGDLELFAPGNDIRGKVALVLKDKSIQSLKKGIEMTGIVPGSIIVDEDCNDGVSRGELCTVHRQKVKQPELKR